MRTLVWYRGKDLRIADHLPLIDGIAGGEVITVFVLDPYFFDKERAGALPHRMQYLLQSLESLSKNIESRGGRLILLDGRSVDVIPDCVRAWGVDRVVAHRWAAPIGTKRDELIRAALNVPFDLYDGETLHHPGTIRTKAGTPFGVYTPFSRAFHREVSVSAPVASPEAIPQPPIDLASFSVPMPSLSDLGLTLNEKVIRGGEGEARKRLFHFVNQAGDYEASRNRMDAQGTSRLSADLKFGTLSPRTVWHHVHQSVSDTTQVSAFINQLVWREFCHSTLWDRPHVLTEPFNPRYRDFPYENNPTFLDAWKTGQTGYPIVDASCRQLLAEGFVHNRARMVSASFLTKHLLCDYRLGEAHYLTYLVDGDWAQNNSGWQWAAGCGCDAQPYFRVFNPVSQGTRHDPEGHYVRRWVPELREMPNRYIHAPWDAPSSVLSSSGVRLGQTYPNPIVEHKEARLKYLSSAKAFLNRQT